MKLVKSIETKDYAVRVMHMETGDYLVEYSLGSSPMFLGIQNSSFEIVSAYFDKKVDELSNLGEDLIYV